MPMLALSLASSLALAGPPALPPLPNEATTPAAEPGAPATTEVSIEESTPVQTVVSPEPAPSLALAPAPAPTPEVAEPPPPAEVAGPPASASPVVVAPRPEPTPELVERPEPRVDVPPPRYRGRGMLIAAGVLGTAGFGIKVWSSAMAGGDPFVLLGAGVLHNPLVGTAIGLLGGGMGMLGHYDAHRMLFDHEPSKRKRRTILGWSLFGAGAGVWALTRAYGALGCSDTDCTVAVWEAGYYVSLAATVPGMAMGAYGSGYRSYTNRFRGLVGRVSVAPLASRNAWGLSLSGRF